MSSSTQDLLRRIPSVEALLQDGRLSRATESVPRKILVDSVRVAVEEARAAILAEPTGDVDDRAIRGAIITRSLQEIREAMGPHYRKVINATGIVLHTALGRAALPAQAVRQIAEELSGYSLLQADIAAGRRDRRDGRIQWLLQQLTGAQAATVVNNNAAATWIVLHAVARGQGGHCVSRAARGNRGLVSPA